MYKRPDSLLPVEGSGDTLEMLFAGNDALGCPFDAEAEDMAYRGRLMGAKLASLPKVEIEDRSVGILLALSRELYELVDSIETCFMFS